MASPLLTAQSLPLLPISPISPPTPSIHPPPPSPDRNPPPPASSPPPSPEHPPQQQHQSAKVSTKRKLYLSHTLSTFNTRLFEFGAVLFLARIWPGTLLPTSVYALIRAGSAIVFSPLVGGYIDRNDRLRVVRCSILGQRAAVVLSCVGFFALVSFSPSPISLFRNAVLGVLCVLACVEKLCAVANLIAVERDWVPVISRWGNVGLGELNSQMRRIDLFCKLFGPLLVAVLDGVSTRIAILVVLGSSALCVGVEYYAIQRVYLQILPLQAPRGGGCDTTDDEDGLQSIGLRRWILLGLAGLVETLSAYTHNEVFLPSMALSLLYLTVLSFSGQMIAYLLSIGLSSTSIGLLRTVSVALEMSATWLAPLAMNKVGPLRAGLWSVSWQVVCVFGAVASIWTSGTPYFAALGLVAGVMLSRVGLWGFDLSVQILLQEGVEPEARGTFSSTEASVQNFFELCAYGSTIVFSRPGQFKYPVFMSAMAVSCASVLYAKFVRDHRGHLLHLSRCMEGKSGPGASRRVAEGIRMVDLP